MPSSAMFSDMDKNILEKMKNINSNYVSSLDTFIDGFSNEIDDVEGFEDDVDGFEDGDDEGFEDDVEGFEDDDEGFEDDDEGFEDDDEFSNIEGMKSKPKKKKKKKKKTKPIPKFDLISYLITKFDGTSKDVSILKQILTILFTVFLAFVVAHNWYSNFLSNPIFDRLESKLSALKQNNLINAISKYFVEIVKTVEEFIMGKISKSVTETAETSSFFGRRFVFYALLSFSFGVVSYFLKQVLIMYNYTIDKINELMFIKKNDSKRLKKYFGDLGTSFLKQFTVNPVITSIVTIMFIIFYVSDVIKENSSSILPPALAQPGAALMVWYIVKFAVLFAPTVMFSSTLLSIYIFYYSVIKNGDKDFYSLYKQNTEHMNEKKVFFDNDFSTSFWSNLKNNVEKMFREINVNFHEIFFFSTIMKIFPYIFSFPSFILKFGFGSFGIIFIYKFITSILTKYKVGTETISKIKMGVAEIEEEYKQIPIVEKIESANIFDQLYAPFKDKNDTTIKTA